jgi:indolepyruvate ferredoxin oxidoreductase
MNTATTARLQTTLDDKYTLSEGYVFMTGTQALTRVPIEQRRRDIAAGLRTGGYISGYPGSPLGGYDRALNQARSILQAHNIVFRPGLNEELAATAVWGSQYVGMFPGATVDGVFGIWYGKGPGVDRSADALRHANWAGTSQQGGTLAVAGDDHGAKSSTLACYSDILFESLGIPLLYPSNVQEILDFGLHGLAMSRFSGAWTGLKAVNDIIESAGTVRLSPDSPRITIPDDTPEARNERAIRTYDFALLTLEERLYHRRLHAALAYARANDLNRIVSEAPEASIGVVAAGKAYQDVRAALYKLGLQAGERSAGGVRLLKIGMVWPLDPEIVRCFAKGLRTIVVVEEKRPQLETQIRAILYGVPDAPAIIGKVREGNLFDTAPSWVFPNYGEITPAAIAAVLAGLAETEREPESSGATRPALVEGGSAGPEATRPPAVVRTPSFCSGCPHNRSTKLPAGSRALAGIGCHGMQIFLDNANCKTVAQMGGEGMHWLGQQPFTEESHVFANLGDGTYAHSGSLAVRQAVASGVPITYKILVNGFISMTGGQTIQGGQSVERIVQALRADGVQRIVVVTDTPDKYPGQRVDGDVPVRPRSEMDVVQRELREYRGVSVVVYEQRCATERRRLRKKGQWEDPPKRAFINTAVCEGCGDCSKVSTCLSVEPVDTEFGRKRRINQSSCNKDFSCVEGFCPSFVTVHGGALRKPSTDGARSRQPFAVPEPELPALAQPFNVLVGGIGGTGVVTIGQTLAMAAFVDEKPCLSLDVTGMAQKYGAVFSHLRFAADRDDLFSPRIGAGETDTLIGCDLIVASGDEPVATLQRGRSRAVVCRDLVPTAEFARNPDWTTNPEALLERIAAGVGEQLKLVDGQRLALALLGDAIASNMLLVGMAWQLGQLPLTRAAIERAIELNGVSVEMNLKAFQWGRCLAHDAARVEQAISGAQVIRFQPRAPEQSLDQLIDYRANWLVDYQDRALATRYRALVGRVRASDQQGAGGGSLSAAVAEGYFKLLAVKDEWEVARLHTSQAFQEEIAQTFEGDYRLHFHIGGWPFAKKDRKTGAVTKRELGPWFMSALRLLARARCLRGTPLDPFRYSAERRFERALLEQYERDIERLLAGLSDENYDTAVALARLPMKIRGYGHVKEAQAKATESERAQLLAAFESPPQALRRAG